MAIGDIKKSWYIAEDLEVFTCAQGSAHTQDKPGKRKGLGHSPVSDLEWLQKQDIKTKPDL